MPIVLYRVDQRLIHGQVVIGWGHHLRPDRYVVVDGALSESSWEQDLYRLGASGTQVLFVAPEEARSALAEWREDEARSILLTRDIPTMGLLAAGGLMSGERVNLGGIHHGPGREEVLTYLHLTEDDMRELDRMASEGVDIAARDLPEAHRVSLRSLLKSRWKSSR